MGRRYLAISPVPHRIDRNRYLVVSLRPLAETVPILREDRDGGSHPKQDRSNDAARLRAPRDLVEYDQIKSCEVAAATALFFAPHGQLDRV